MEDVYGRSYEAGLITVLINPRTCISVYLVARTWVHMLGGGGGTVAIMGTHVRGALWQTWGHMFGGNCGKFSHYGVFIYFSVRRSVVDTCSGVLGT